MLELIQKRPGAVIFAAALLTRSLYLLFVTQPPVQFDARQYASVAAVAPLALTHPSLWNDTTARENISFSNVVNDLVDDENIIWSPYDPPTYGQALDWLFFSGPAYPAFLSSIYHVTPAFDFWIVRILQAFIDSLTAMLIFLIMRRLLSERGGFIAAFAWIVYGPAIIKTGELLTETFATFLVVAMVWCLLRAYDTRKLRWMLTAGALCSLLALTKASTTLLIVPIAGAWIWASHRNNGRPLSGAAIFAVAWIIVMIPWLLLVNHRYGQFAVRDPSYGDANFRQANILETEGYNTDMAPTDFWTYPVWREIQDHPLEYARLYLQKFRRLWWRACDDYRIGFPFGEAGTQWLHKFIVLFSAVGVFVWTRRAGPVAWFPLAVIAYFAGLHTIMHVVSRYNLLAMPFVMGASVCGAMWLADEGRPGVVRRLGAIIAIIAGTALLIHALRPTTWLILPGVSVPLATWLFWIGSVVTILVVASLAVLVRGRKDSARWPVMLSVGGLVTVVFLAWATTREAYAEWVVHIDEPGLMVKREITIPPEILRQKVKLANILVDGIVARGSHFEIAMGIDHIRSTFPDSFLTVSESFYGKPQYRSFMRMNGDNSSQVRCWSRNIVEGPLLDSILQDGAVEVSLTVKGDPAVKGYLAVFGDLPQDSSQVFHGPGLTSSSIERYYEGTDPRIWERLPLGAEPGGSSLVRGDKADKSDLSPCFGRQAGQYRIILRLLLDDERSLYF